MNIPWTTVCLFLGSLAAIVTLIATGHSNDSTVTILVGLLPGFLAAGFAERSNRDIRNGVVEEKVKTGTRKALDESGVTAVAQSSSESTRLAMNALSKLLESNTAANVANTAVKTEGGNPNGGQTV